MNATLDHYFTQAVADARDLFVIDLFAGGGGASEGIRRALGRCPNIAINHNPKAVEMHTANHPSTRHLCESVWDVEPRSVCAGRSPDLLWASPDCTHFSRARGGKPKDKKIRGLAWRVVRWAAETRPTVIAMENVPEFVTWGPLTRTGRVIKHRMGETFDVFVGHLRALGYAVEWRNLVACDYGAPTSRKRLFLIARRDGAPIVWPEPTHGPGRSRPHRGVVECIDFTIPTRSIFERKKPLAAATQRRIAEGLRRFVLEDPNPYIVRIGQTSSDSGKVAPVSAPLSTITTKAEHLLCIPSMVHIGNGEREGQAPRVMDIRKPAGTFVASGTKQYLVSAWIAKHFTGVTGHRLDRPLGAITARDHHSLVTAMMVEYYGTATARRITDPLATLTSVDRFGLVTVELCGSTWAVIDIHMRMLEPREQATAQGFRPDYILTGTKRDQTARIGNSVSPDPAEALIRANVRVPRAMAAK